MQTTTRPAHPHGCMGVQGALATSDSGRGARDLLVARRDNGYTRAGFSRGSVNEIGRCDEVPV
ncbi:hypothetical protein [Actinoallomurus iriomotensis]|uniref:Uncharacterized protein n=1 Tax=Actinoallomurus iriomotensis TaxID=478107 RepID=A0A9W6W417_9ACTN|nr:hypothetical protein [Actinoallomurus iriomotensis]GLY89482.1 hypothetical protein Airi02_074110 [Actinoallomurus iriomotensis]